MTPCSILMYSTAAKQWRLIPQGMDWGEGSEYWWTEGNMSCDCNRGLEWDRGGGVKEADLKMEDYKCGQVAFQVPFALLADGGCIPIDERSDSNADY